ncbi:inositol monophosphatase [Rhodococcus aerolatus]
MTRTPATPDHATPDPETTDELRAVAVEVATAAAGLVARRRRELFGPGGGVPGGSLVATKSSATDPVTVVDTECEAFLRERLGAARPDVRVLGEEGGGDAGDVAGLRWVVDPIDGTVNFLYGLPGYAVSIGAQLDGRTVAGAVVDVPTGEVYAAGLGRGATLDGAPLRCSAADDLALALVGTGFGYDAARRARQGRLVAGVLPRVRDVRRGGSAALDLCSVAAGRLDAYYEHGTNPWDWAAGSLVAAEAGAVVRLPDPDALGRTGQLVLAGAPGVVDDLGALLLELGAEDVGRSRW